MIIIINLELVEFAARLKWLKNFLKKVLQILEMFLKIRIKGEYDSKGAVIK